ncbi:MAG: molecular chaperone DnaJ [Verrucomicrobia bacterium]|nr:molecular chaperone DnaJ [Verrucomicrobiota bacterium]
MAKADYYEILEVPKSASDEEIKKAYRKMALKYHPDRNQGNKAAEEKFKEVSEAYEVLANSEKRAAYDRFGHAAFGPGSRTGPAAGGFHDPFDIFQQVFGGAGNMFSDFFGGGGDRDGAQGGNDLRYDMEITFEEAAFGCEKEVSIRRNETCDTCNGDGAAPGSSMKRCSQCSGRGQVTNQRGFFMVSQTCPRCRGAGRVIEKPCTTCNGGGLMERQARIKIRVPGGVENGMRLRSSGNGESGVRGGTPGDLYVVLHVREHEIFKRDGEDIYCEVPISYALAALGGELEVPTLDGNARVRIPPGTQSSTLFRLRGKGVRSLDGHGLGDEHVRVIVEVPTRLNSDQRRKLEDFARSCNEDVFPMRKSFMDSVKRMFSGR